MKFQTPNIALFLILLGLLSMCKEKYDFKINPEFNLAIDGGIHDGPGPNYLLLTTTSYSDRPATPVTGAVVYITDDTGATEFYVEEGKGRYRLDGTQVQGTPGHSYAVTFELQNGRTYHSSFERMPTAALAQDSTYWEMVAETIVSSEGVPVINHNVKVYLNSQLTKGSSTAYYRWGMDEVYSIYPYCPPGAISCPSICYVFQPVSSYNLIQLKLDPFATERMDRVLMISRGLDYTFNTEHFFNVTQYVMNEANYEYWSKIQDLVVNRGSIFDTPPAKIKGNIVNESDPNEIVFGYFEATRQLISRSHVNRGNVPIYIVSCDDYPERQYYRFCQSCEYLPGSTTPKPSWWY